MLVAITVCKGISGKASLVRFWRGWVHPAVLTCKCDGNRQHMSVTFALCKGIKQSQPCTLLAWSGSSSRPDLHMHRNNV
jgi:hypothetical protein